MQDIHGDLEVGKLDNGKDIIINDLVGWLREKVESAKAQGLVFGLSGGIDSAVLAGISKLAFPDNSLAIIMPCHSDPVDEEHGILVAESLNIEYTKVDLSQSYDSLLNSFKISKTNKMAQANLKPRLRMTTLYYFAQSYNYLVAGATNRSELTIGYFTKHGDSGVDLLPLASFVKSEIKSMARLLKIPDIIINKAPSAGLWTNQTDEEEMGFSYEILDSYILTSRGEGQVYEKIERMKESSSHKREYPSIFHINK